MAYLPGMPGAGAHIAAPATTIGKPARGSMGSTGIARTASGVGKPGSTEHLGNITGPAGRAPKVAVSGGNTGNHQLGQYGKAPTVGAISAVPGMAAGTSPTAHAGAAMIRGGSGAMRSHIREGGLGPGTDSSAGPSNTDYSMNSADQE